jgi:hypothetical protein
LSTQGFESGARIQRLVDNSAQQAYYPLVTKDTSMETGRTSGEETQRHLSVTHEGTPDSPLEALDRPREETLSVYPYKRFLAVMRGEIPLVVYAREVTEFVEAQLPQEEKQFGL